ncbi:hypothetical protein HZA42_04105 [Candidatus Peregrinibacteria bacterium]|nr:hypothetical protein [Candidatus Peregrinibacteria bacterium]
MRSGSDTKRELGESFKKILDSASAKGAIRPIKKVHKLLYDAAGGRTPYSDKDSTQLKSGLAVSPSGAAACLLDYERTRQFVRGLNMAITEARKHFHDEVIQVLYAGCGPFAPLAIAQCWTFSPDKVQFTLLDIHETSVDIARAIVQSFDLKRHCPRIIKADATKYKCQGARPHIVVTETMMSTLMYEPQAAITANLAPEMRHGGIFVPEEVALDAYIEEPPESGHLDGPKRPLGLVFRLTKDTRPNAKIKSEFALPAVKSKKGFENLLISTRVRVFGNIAIEPDTAEITKSLFVTSFDREDEGSLVAMEYVPGDTFLKYVMQGDGPFKETRLAFPAVRSEFTEGQLSFRPK